MQTCTQSLLSIASVSSSKTLEPATLSKVFVTTSLAEWFQPMFNGVQLKWYKSGTDWVAGAVN